MIIFEATKLIELRKIIKSSFFHRKVRTSYAIGLGTHYPLPTRMCTVRSCGLRCTCTYLRNVLCVHLCRVGECIVISDLQFSDAGAPHRAAPRRSRREIGEIVASYRRIIYLLIESTV